MSISDLKPKMGAVEIQRENRPKVLCYADKSLRICNDCSCIESVTRLPRCCDTKPDYKPVGFPHDWKLQPKETPGACSNLLSVIGVVLVAIVLLVLLAVTKHGKTKPVESSYRPVEIQDSASQYEDWDVESQSEEDINDDQESNLQPGDRSII